MVNKLQKIKNYLNLIRFDKQTGTFLLLIPCLWGFAFADSNNLSNHLNIIIFFTIGAFIMRSSGCIINDIWDREIDKKVARTKTRPLASGEVSLKEALVIFTILNLAGLYILLQLRQLTIIIGLCSFIFVILYPLAKRVIKVPQIMLGLTFNIGAIMAYAEVTGVVRLEVVILYIACFFWTLAYDTIYAHQDKKDDLEIGVKSAALTFGKDSKTYIAIFYLITSICLLILGFITMKGISYFVLILAALLWWFLQIYKINLDDPKQCMKGFKNNQYIGILIFIAII